MREYFAGKRKERSPLIYQVLATAFEIKGLFRESVDAMVEALTACNHDARAEAIQTQWEAGGYAAVLHWLLEDLLARHRQGYTSAPARGDLRETRETGRDVLLARRRVG